MYVYVFLRTFVIISRVQKLYSRFNGFNAEDKGGGQYAPCKNPKLKEVFFLIKIYLIYTKFKVDTDYKYY